MDNVAEQANAIVNTCPVNPKGKVCGQLFADGDGWNVIIDKDSGLRMYISYFRLAVSCSRLTLLNITCFPEYQLT